MQLVAHGSAVAHVPQGIDLGSCGAPGSVTSSGAVIEPPQNSKAMARDLYLA
jgi:hypothetical protein